MSEADIRYKNYKIGKVVEVEDIQKNLKKVGVAVEDIEEPETIEVVTNAKHISEGNIVILALPGAIVPAGSESEADGGQGIVVSKQAVGGV